MVIIFIVNKPSKKLLSNLHMCWESATCNRFRKHPFRWSGDGDLKTSGLYVRAFSGCTDRFLCTFFSKACRYSVAASPRLWVARALVYFSSHRAPPCSRLFDLRSSPWRLFNVLEFHCDSGISSLLAFAVCSETLSDGIRFVAKPAVDVTFMWDPRNLSVALRALFRMFKSEDGCHISKEPIPHA